MSLDPDLEAQIEQLRLRRQLLIPGHHMTAPVKQSDITHTAPTTQQHEPEKQVRARMVAGQFERAASAKLRSRDIASLIQEHGEIVVPVPRVRIQSNRPLELHTRP